MRDEKVFEQSKKASENEYYVSNSHAKNTRYYARERIKPAEPAVDHKGETVSGTEADLKTPVSDPVDEKKEIFKARIALFVIAVLVLAGAGAYGYKYYHSIVPSVVGMEAEQGQAEIEAAGLKYTIEEEFSKDVDKGCIISQSVDEGEQVKRNSTITLVISRGKSVKVPNFKNLTVSEAKKKAENKGIKIKKDGKKSSDSIAEGRIISQEIKAGEKCEKGATIKVVVSSGPNASGSETATVQQTQSSKKKSSKGKSSSESDSSDSEEVIVIRVEPEPEPEPTPTPTPTPTPEQTNNNNSSEQDENPEGDV